MKFKVEFRLGISSIRGPFSFFLKKIEVDTQTEFGAGKTEVFTISLTKDAGTVFNSMFEATAATFVALESRYSEGWSPAVNEIHITPVFSDE